MQFEFLPNVCKASSRNFYIAVTVEMTNNTWLWPYIKYFLGFNLIYMNITDYHFLQSLNIAKLTLKQLVWLKYKLPNYTMVNYDSLREQIQKIAENYPYSMPI